MTKGSISIVVPTRDRRELLRGCLDALLAQTRPADEILVVDNGSTDGTSEMVRRDFAGARLRLFREAKRGVDRARNRGIVEARGDAVAFTDDDCLATPRWVEGLAACFEDASTAGAGGPVLPRWPVAPPAFLLRSKRTISSLGLLDLGSRRRRLDHESEFLMGCNMAFRRSLLIESRGFGGLFPFLYIGVCGDDYELSKRLSRRHCVLYEPSAAVTHRILPGKLSYAHLLLRAFCFEAGNARLGSRLKPGRGPRELTGWEGLVSLALSAGHAVGRLTPKIPERGAGRLRSGNTGGAGGPA